MSEAWWDLPELKELGRHLAAARLRSGFSQTRLARASGLSQAQVSLFESGRRLPSLDQFVRIARALDAPLQELIGGSGRPGGDLAGLAVELRGLGAVDLWVAGAAVPGAARRPEEVLARALAGAGPDPRVVEAVPALLAWNRTRPALLRAFGGATGTTRRLAWLAEVALAIDRRRGFPGGCRRGPLGRFVASVPPPSESSPRDDLGSPGDGGPASPIWRRWGIGYGATPADFERRAEALAAARAGDAGRARPGRPRGGDADGR